jgi:beta-glucosidase
VKTVTFVLTPDDLALWDRSMHFVVEPGMFKVMVGSSSGDIRLSGEFEITRPWPLTKFGRQMNKKTRTN